MAESTKLTHELIDDVIVSKKYHVFPGTNVTVCLIELRNGSYVTGEHVCADHHDFDKGIGEDVARAKARDKIWALESYLLKEFILASNQ